MQISEILSFLKEGGLPFTFTGNETDEVEHFSSLRQYKPGTFTWVKKAENIPENYDLSQITLAVASETVEGNFRNVIHTPESKRVFFSTIEHFYMEEKDCPAVGQFTYISPKVKLGKNVRIGHNCTLDGDITIGDNTIIWNHVTLLNRVSVGQECEIQSGTVIGHDGFAYTEDADHKKTMVKHFGGVSIGDQVLIGENCCINRGTIDDTVIGRGAKIAHLCHVAHNVQIGENVFLISGCIVNGSCQIKNNAYIAGLVVRNQSVIGENAFVGLGAVVVKDVEPGQTVVGNPAKPFVRKKE